MRKLAKLMTLVLSASILFGFMGCSDESDENKSTSKMVGKYMTVDHTAKLDVKADYTIFVDTGSEEDNMNGTWKETDKGGEFTFQVGGVEFVGTAEIKEDDVIRCVSEDMDMRTYAVKISNTAVDMKGTWSNGTMTTTVDAEGNFSIRVSEDSTITGTVTVEGNSFVMEDSEGNEVSTGVVSASGKAYMEYYNGEDMVQDIFEKQDESDEKQDESDENKSTSEIVGTYKLVNHTAKLNVKADYTVFVDTGYDEYNMNGSWKETAKGGEFTFPAGEGVEVVGTAEIKEDDVIWCVCEDLDAMCTYAVKISNTAVIMEGTWSNGTMTTTIDADGNFSIPMSEDFEITGKATVEGNSFVMEDSDGEVVSTGVVSASGKAYMQYFDGEDLVQDIFEKQQ